MLYLLDKEVQTVKWNGIPLYEAVSARVKETLNGDFTLTLKYPITDSHLYRLLKVDKLIKAPVPELGEQLFRIKKPVEMDEHVEVLCYHITDDIMQHSIKPIGNSQVGCMTALSSVVQAAKTSLEPFSFTSDIAKRRDFNTTETTTLYKVLLDGAHSIIGTWEGELIRDNFSFSIQEHRGQNSAVIITTHQNLKSYKRNRSSQNVVTRIHVHSTFKPEGTKEEKTLTVTVDSPLLNAYPYINEKEFTNNNLKTLEELRKWGESKFFHDKIDREQDAIVIEAYELDGQTVHLGDWVTLKSRKHYVDLLKQTVAYEYDALAKEYVSLTFDDKVREGGHNTSSKLTAAAHSILTLAQGSHDLMIERALENANRAFDAAFEKQESKVLDGIEKAKAKAEEIAAQTRDQIQSSFTAFTKSTESTLHTITQKTEEALGKVGATQQALNKVQEVTNRTIAELKVFQTETLQKMGTFVSKTEVKQTLSGLETTLQQVQGYVSKDGERRERLEQYVRTETANQARTVREQVAKDYVAKASYSEDVKGLNRRFENLQIGGRNYIRHYDFDGLLPLSSNVSEWKFERVSDTNAKSGYYLKATCTKAGNGGFHKPIFDLRGAEWQGKKMVYSADMKSSRSVVVRFGFETGGVSTVTLQTEWNRFVHPFTVKFERYWSWVCYSNGWLVGDVLYIRDPQLEDGTIATTPSPAPEDDRQYTETKIASYSQTVEGRFSEILQTVNGKTSSSDFQKVQETVNLYSRLIGSKEDSVKHNLAQIVLTDSSYVTKVTDLTQRVSTVQTQLANSWSVQHLTSSGAVLNSLNLLANGVNHIHGRLTHITGQTLIDHAVIKSAMVDKLKTANFESGSVTTAILSAEAVTAEKLKVDDALFNKLSATEAYLRKLFSKQAFISQVQSVTLSANKISGGILTAINRAMEISLNAGQILYYTDQAALKRVLTGYPTQFIKFATGNVDGKGRAGVTVIGSNRYGSESSNDSGFVGIRAWNGYNIDSLDLVGDELSFASSAYDNKDGWVMTTTGKLQLRPSRKQDRRDSTINTGDVWLYLDTSGNYVSLHEVLQRMSNSIGALYEYRASHSEGHPAWWDTRNLVGHL